MSEGGGAPDTVGGEYVQSQVALCDNFVGEILQYFYAAVGDDRLTEDAHNHLLRLAPYVICYAFEVGSKSDPDWWDREGRTYWEDRVDQLVADYLPETGTIDGATLQLAVNTLANEVTARLTSLLEDLDAREIVRRARNSSAGGPSIKREDVITILGFCPFSRKKPFTL